MVVGNDTDISASFTGACSYSAFTDYMSDCGTGNSIGVGGNGVTATGSYAFDSGFSIAAGLSSKSDSSVGILTDAGTDSFGIETAYTADSWGVSVGYVYDDNNTSAETTTWGINGSYTFDSTSLPTISVGYETVDATTDESGYFVGLTFPEVGPGSVNIAAATKALYADSATEYLIYEASYSYPVNDGMTITPGVYVREGSTDETGFAVKTSFSF